MAMHKCAKFDWKRISDIFTYLREMGIPSKIVWTMEYEMVYYRIKNIATSCGIQQPNNNNNNEFILLLQS
jgi:hypothetical protein